jgi:hypothetical protein
MATPTKVTVRNKAYFMCVYIMVGLADPVGWDCLRIIFGNENVHGSWVIYPAVY